MLFADLAFAQLLNQKEALGISNIVASMDSLYPGSSRGLWLEGGAYAAYTGPTMPINRVVSMGMHGPVDSATLDQAEQFYTELNMPTEVDVCPLADPSLFQLLGERGYRLKRFLNFMYRPLTSADTWLDLPTGPVNLEVEVTPMQPTEVELWANTSAQGFTESDGPLPEDEIKLCRVLAGRTDALLFLARVNGEVAGSGLLSMANGVASLASTSTLPAFRSRGVQTALINTRLKLAAESGCDVAMVLTTPGSASQRNMHRHSFQIAYTTFTMIREL
jgi:hypothetical protein